MIGGINKKINLISELDIVRIFVQNARASFSVHELICCAMIHQDNTEFTWERLLSVCGRECCMRHICSNTCVA